MGLNKYKEKHILFRNLMIHKIFHGSYARWHASLVNRLGLGFGMGNRNEKVSPVPEDDSIIKWATHQEIDKELIRAKYWGIYK